VFCYTSEVPASTAAILRLAESRPVISAREFRDAGVPARLLGKLTADGKLRRIGRGLYAHPDAAVGAYQSLIEVAKQAPKAVVCLLSALQAHEIGTQAPFEVWIALPAGTHAPRIAYPPLRVVRLSGRAFTAGIDTKRLDGVPVRIYDAAKTITDCFKLRNKIGLDAALEALREAWRTRKVTMEDLERYAEINRMTNVMRPYLESLVA
jgi:predicted transcriptional regulator of viral defense system